MSRKKSFIEKHGCLAFFILVIATMLLMVTMFVYVKLGLPLIFLGHK